MRPEDPEPLNMWREDESRLVTDSSPRTLPSTDATEADVRHRGQLFSWPVLITMTLLLSLLVLMGDAAYGLARLNEHLGNVREHLLAVEDGFTTGDVDTATREVRAAEAAAQAAAGAARRPSLVLATFVPGLDRDAEALAGLVETARLTTSAASAAVEAARKLDLDDQGAPQGLYSDGRVQLEAMTSAREDILAAERSLLAAVLLMERLNPRLDQLRGPLGDIYTQARSALDHVARARTYFELIPSLLGDKEPRSYLLAFQTPGEARATGGFMGFFGVLTAEDGILDLEQVRPLAEVQPGPGKDVEAPGWFRDAYGIQGALANLQQVNVSPNYPVVSDAVLKMYERATGKQLDGVFAMDPIALEGLMAATGDLRTENPPMVVRPEDVSELLLRDSYTEFTADEQNVFLAELLDAFWTRIAEGEIDANALADGLGDALRTQHLKIHSAGNDQQSIETLGLGGRYDIAGQRTQMVFNNNYGANKIDYFLHRDIATDIELQDDGTALVTTTVTLDNRAPTGPASVLLGTGGDRPIGTNLMTLNLLMPPGSVVSSFQVEGADRDTFSYADDLSPVAWDILEIPPGESRTVVLQYSVPNVISSFEQGTVFDFALFPQPTVNPDAFSISIQPPPGSVVVEAGPGAIQEDGSAAFSGTLGEPFSIRLQMSPR